MTISDDIKLTKDDQVKHPEYGTGAVVTDLGETVVVRFGQSIQECAREDLNEVPSLLKRINSENWDIPLELINRVQAEAISSINNTWGVFARSRIELLPHQLWVCKQVIKEWPTRWMVADDVGLGKTVEAGIILTALLHSGKVKRLLVLCPAGLVEQWQYRLRTMFDIRLTVYTSEADTERSGFWETQNWVVASLQTLRMDRNDRLNRLCESEHWDLVIVDEAHHLNADEQGGMTLGYQLIKKLQDYNKIDSMVFFSGTPHRGKNYGFFALMHLLRPNLFDPKGKESEQYQQLSKVMIRNNKYNVTDLVGNPLFQEHTVNSVVYTLSEQEQTFYDTLSEFILKGKAYASGLPQAQSQTAILVLIAMQKLASSSVAAIRRAIKGRLDRIQGHREKRAKLEKVVKEIQKYQELEQSQFIEEASKFEEEIAELSSKLQLMEDEIPALQTLNGLAAQIEDETKISKIIKILHGEYHNRTVLFFTEYKATQSLLMSALFKSFGDGCATFINGDGQAEEVKLQEGTVTTLYESKDRAADKFNSGEVRFLVSTEAAGEGIDLQENCHTLIHVDLPWNPMRLHQRVGRLNRYGQKKRVEVLSMRNSESIESMIWDKLNAKLQNIDTAFQQVMNTPEDIQQLVLGMTSNTVFRDIFFEASNIKKEAFDHWFDQKTATLGGKDVVESVKSMVGSVTKFDFQQVSDKIPRVDLPDLSPFLEISIGLNGKRVVKEDERYTFNTPDRWRRNPGIQQKYSNMHFDRKDRARDSSKKLLGVGHKIIDIALQQAKNRQVMLTAIPKKILVNCMFIYRVNDRITSDYNQPDVIAGVEFDDKEEPLKLLMDWQILKKLNSIQFRKDILKNQSKKPNQFERIEEITGTSEEYLYKYIHDLNLSFRVPNAELISIFYAMRD
jgi:ERCC4-related helicase